MKLSSRRVSRATRKGDKKEARELAERQASIASDSNSSHGGIDRKVSTSSIQGMIRLVKEGSVKSQM